MATVSAVLFWILRGCLADTPPAWPDTWTAQDAQLMHDLAACHRVTPYLGWRYAQNPPDTGIYGPLQKALHRTRLQHQLAMVRLSDILSIFSENGLTAFPLKGPQLADEVYPESGLRPSDDLDLLVSPHQVREADKALQALGYGHAPHALPLLIQRSFHFHAGYQHSEHKQYVELHWRPADISILPRWRENWLTGLQHNPAANATYLTVHLAKHAWALQDVTCSACDPLLALHPWSDIRLLWILDLHLLMKRFELCPDELLPTAQKAGVVETVQLVCKLYERLMVSARQGLPAQSTLAQIDQLPSKMLRTMQADLESDRAPAPPPWTLRMHTTLGLRPIRYLNALGRGAP